MRWCGRFAIALGAAVTLLPLRHPAAEDRPPPLPTRDVTVEYKLVIIDDSGAPSAARTIKVYWAGGGTRLRIEMPDENSYVILDRTTKVMTLVLLDQRGYVQLPYDPQRPTGLTVPAGLPLTRAGTEIVVGNPCNVWVQKSDQGSTQLCVNDDGVLLHAEGRVSALHDDLRATSVIYGPQPPGAFTAPADFKKLDPPRSAAAARTPG